MAGALEGDVFIGKRAQEFRGLLKIKYPMEHGIVTDWDDMERIWSWVYAEELGLPKEVGAQSVQARLVVHEPGLQAVSGQNEPADEEQRAQLVQPVACSAAGVVDSEEWAQRHLALVG